jgi:hypothetical protein
VLDCDELERVKAEEETQRDGLEAQLGSLADELEEDQ